MGPQFSKGPEVLTPTPGHLMHAGVENRSSMQKILPKIAFDIKGGIHTHAPQSPFFDPFLVGAT